MLLLVGAVLLVALGVALVVLAVRPELERRADRAAVAQAYEDCGLETQSWAELDRENGNLTMRWAGESTGSSRGPSASDVTCVGEALAMPDDVLDDLVTLEPSRDEHRWGHYYTTWLSWGGQSFIGVYADWHAVG